MPNLVVICESGQGEVRLRTIFADLDPVIHQTGLLLIATGPTAPVSQRRKDRG